MKLSEAANEAIDLAEKIRDYWDVELPKRHPHYPLISPAEDSGPSPPEEDGLQSLLDALSEEDIYKIMMLMYLGRGDFDAESLEDAFAHVVDTIGTPGQAISQMIGKGPLAEYLRDGLELLRKRGIDVDNLRFKPVNSYR